MNLDQASLNALLPKDSKFLGRPPRRNGEEAQLLTDEKVVCVVLMYSVMCDKWELLNRWPQEKK
jgi:hypothetical protein